MGAPRKVRKRGSRYRMSPVEPVRIAVPGRIFDAVALALRDAGHARGPGRYPGIAGDEMDLGGVLLVVEPHANTTVAERVGLSEREGELLAAARAVMVAGGVRFGEERLRLEAACKAYPA